VISNRKADSDAEAEAEAETTAFKAEGSLGPHVPRGCLLEDRRWAPQMR